MIDPDEIWNRAAEGTDRHGRAGDHALAAALLVHGMVENGGVLHAIEGLEPAELEAGVKGYTWLGLASVAELVTRLRSEVEAGALDDDDRAEALEESSNGEYATLVPDDDTLDEAFRRRLEERPDEFAPLKASRGGWGRLFGR